MAVAITPTVQTNWPPRVALAVTGLTAGNIVTVYRLVNGARTAVRGAKSVTVPGTSLAVIDAELPYALTVTWVVQVNGADAVTATPAIYSLPGNKVALSDAITSASAEVITMAWPTRSRERKGTAFALTNSAGAGYNLVVAGAASQATGEVELYTDTDAAFDALTSLLVNATSSIVQYRSGTQPRNNCYFSVLNWDEVRWSQDGDDPRRRWVLSVVELNGWPTAYKTRSWTYSDWAAAYSTDTYATVQASYSTYLDAAVVDLSQV